MKNLRRGAAAALAALLTLIVAGLAFAAAAPPTDTKAAIVNLDEGVTLEGQWVPMGRQLAAEMVLQESQFEWEMSNPELAADGLEDGTYQVVVTIPTDFSAAVTSLASGGAVVQAQIDIEARPGASTAEADAAELVTRAAAVALGGQISEQFVTGLVGGLGEMTGQLGEAADGAAQLASGTADLHEGTAGLADGTAQLALGASAAATGVSQLASGADQLATGASAAAAGVGQLASGADQLVGGIGLSASGASQLAGGTADLAAGSQQISSGLADYTAGVTQYAEGAYAYADGMSQFASTINGMIGTVNSTVTDVADAAQAIGDELGLQVGAYLSAHDVEPLIQQAAAAANALAQACLADPALAACRAFTPEQLQQMADPNLGAQLTAAVMELPETIPATTTALIDGVLVQLDPVLGGLNQLDQAATDLDEGATQLASGAYQLQLGAEQLSLGTGALASGAGQLSGGVDQLAGGLQTAATEAAPLVEGAHAAASGVNQLAEGTGALATGATQASDGLNQLATGSAELAAGTEALNSGTEQLATGSAELADGLGMAVGMIPAFSEQQIADMSVAVTQPVVPPSVSTGVSGAAAHGVALLLWLLSLVVTWIYPVFSPKISQSVQPSFRLAFSMWWRPAAWLAGAGAFAAAALGAWAGQSFGTCAIMAVMGLVIGVVFVGVQQALAAALGAFGRVLSVAALAWAAFATVPLLPTGLATDLLNSYAITGLPAATFALVGLLVWTAVAYAVVMWATARRRATQMEAFA